MTLRPLVTLLLCSAILHAQDRVPSPREVFGHDIGADHFLADYTQLRDYFAKVEAASDRVRIVTIGTTSYGQPMVLAVITSPRNHERLDALRATSARLARAKDPGLDTARALASEGRAVVWIDGGLHATESVAGQNVIELVYRMASGDDARTRKILDEVVLLVCPVNPDGLELIARAYMATRRVGGLPVLYQRYIGHDNNRDHYLVSQPETAAVARVLYHEWFPQIVYNHHQSAPQGTVIFTPPFRDPFNYAVDPIVVRGIELVATHMNWAFAREGKAGVISRSGAPYSTWWNGGLRTTTYFHNMIGILTEVFGSPNPTPLNQGLDRRLPTGDYPMPVPAQVWHARDTIEYLMTANFAILELAANYREQLLFDIWRMGRNSIERGSRDHVTVTPRVMEIATKRREELRERRLAGSRPAGSGQAGGRSPERSASRPADEPVATADRATTESRPAEGDPAPAAEGEPRLARAEAADVDAVFADASLRDPRAFIVPMPQRGSVRAIRFLQSLQRTGIELLRATSPFAANGRTFAAGSYVVSCAQAFRPHVLDMFEPQWHPTDLGKDGQPVRPYDSAGWTLALQMDVEVERVLEGLSGPFTPVDAPILLPSSEVPPARVGLFDVWGGEMATGWTEWLLKEHGVTPALVFGGEVEAGDLQAKYDTLLFHTGLPDTGGAERTQRALERARERETAEEETQKKLLDALPPFEDWSRARDRRVRITREKGVPNLRAFVENGGTLVALGSQASAIIRLFELPLRAGTWTAGEDGKDRRTTSREFFVPGSLLRLELVAEDPIVDGVRKRIAAMFRGSTAFDVLPAEGGPQIDVLARWAERDLLASGWALGEQYLAGRAAVVVARLGKGRVVILGPDVVYRGQALGTFQMVLNAIHSAR